MDFLTQAAQFILSLSLLIILHELGHFIPAKLFKTRVEKFYLFFDPWFSLVKKKIKGTEYGIGWLPLGGYVKIAGMIDESMDKEQMKKPPQPWEFRSKPAWQRLIIMIGGVTVNVILAMIIYIGMMMHWGDKYIPNENLVYGIATDSTAEAIGLRDGDKIISVGDLEIERFSQIAAEIALASDPEIKLERGGEIVTLNVKSKDKEALFKAKAPVIAVRMPYVVGGFTDSSTASVAGLQKGDSIISFQGKPLYFFDQYVDEIPKYTGETVSLGYMRDGKFGEVEVEVPQSGKIGVFPIDFRSFIDLAYKSYGFWDAIPAGLNKAYSTLVNYLRQFKVIADTETGAYKQVGGFKMIFDQYKTYWEWYSFWDFTAFLSIMLAVLNMLPIPALDGGHVVFVLWEMITGRKPKEKVLEYAQVVGFILLLTLIVLANGNDFLKWWNGA